MSEKVNAIESMEKGGIISPHDFVSKPDLVACKVQIQISSKAFKSQKM